jgi:hypothetical protein
MRLYLYAAAALIPATVLIWWLLAVLINRPEGDHHRPPWWRRIRERRLEERAQNAVTVRLFEDIKSGLRGEAARAATSEMPRVEWPLKPLPPGAEEYADHFHRPLPPEVRPHGDPECDRDQDHECPGPGCTYPLPVPSAEIHRWLAEPEDLHEVIHAGIGEAERGETVTHEDPLDVATPEQVADEYVGLAGQPGKNGSDEAGLIGPLLLESLPSPAPEPESAPLTDYGPTTGSWEAIRDAVMPKDGAR